MTDDQRKLCRVCFEDGEYVSAAVIAPQHTNGDVDEPATWIPVCSVHLRGWYDDIEEYEILPTFPI